MARKRDRDEDSEFRVHAHAASKRTRAQRSKKASRAGKPNIEPQTTPLHVNDTSSDSDAETPVPTRTLRSRKPAKVHSQDQNLEEYLTYDGSFDTNALPPFSAQAPTWRNVSRVKKSVIITPTPESDADSDSDDSLPSVIPASMSPPLIRGRAPIRKKKVVRTKGAIKRNMKSSANSAGTESLPSYNSAIVAQAISQKQAALESELREQLQGAKAEDAEHLRQAREERDQLRAHITAVEELLMEKEKVLQTNSATEKEYHRVNALNKELEAIVAAKSEEAEQAINAKAEVQNVLNDYINENTRLTNKVQRLKDEVARLQGEAVAHKDKLDLYESEMSDLDEAARMFQSRFINARAESIETKKRLEDTEQELIDAEQGLLASQKELETTRMSLKMANAKYRGLEGMLKYEYMDRWTPVVCGYCGEEGHWKKDHFDETSDRYVGHLVIER